MFAGPDHHGRLGLGKGGGFEVRRDILDRETQFVTGIVVRRWNPQTQTI